MNCDRFCGALFLWWIFTTPRKASCDIFFKPWIGFLVLILTLFSNFLFLWNVSNVPKGHERVRAIEDDEEKGKVVVQMIRRLQCQRARVGVAQANSAHVKEETTTFWHPWTAHRYGSLENMKRNMSHYRDYVPKLRAHDLADLKKKFTLLSDIKYSSFEWCTRMSNRLTLGGIKLPLVGLLSEINEFFFSFFFFIS